MAKSSTSLSILATLRVEPWHALSSGQRCWAVLGSTLQERRRASGRPVCVGVSQPGRNSKIYNDLKCGLAQEINQRCKHFLPGAACKRELAEGYVSSSSRATMSYLL